MLDPEMSTEKTSLETYLLTTFSRIEDQNGVKLNITPALPVFVAILTDTATDLANKKYDFIGEAACQFAIRCILTKNFPDYDDRILTALAKKFRALQQVNKIVLKDIQLKQHVDFKLLSPQIVQTISGVLYSYFGTPAVEKFIESAVSSIASCELGQADAQRLKINREENALQKFNTLVQTTGGTIEVQAQETPDKQWEVKVVAKLKSTSLVFSHARVGGSKQKAKSAAYQDILTYLDNHPDVYEQLQVANIESHDIHPLPISENEYVMSTASTPTSAQNMTAADLLRNGDSSNLNLSFTNDEDAIRQLSRLLLGGDTVMDSSDDLNESPTKKRMRDDQRQQQTGMEGMFSSYIGSESVDVKSEPVIIKREPDLEAKREQLLASISNDNQESSAPVQTTPVVAPMQASISTPRVQPTTTATGDTPMEEEPYNPFVGAPPTIEVNPKIILYFKQIFKNNRNTLLQAMTMPGQCKSIFLSLVVQNSDKVAVDLKSNQVGPPHGPVFNAELVLKSKEYGNVIIKTDAVARRKKDAECHVFHKLVCLLK